MIVYHKSIDRRAWSIRQNVDHELEQERARERWPGSVVTKYGLLCRFATMGWEDTNLHAGPRHRAQRVSARHFQTGRLELVAAQAVQPRNTVIHARLSHRASFVIESELVHLQSQPLFLPLKLVLGLLVGQILITRSLVNSRPVRLALFDVTWLFDMPGVSCAAFRVGVMGDTARDSVQSLRVDL